jgi:2'-5' RNA ligase
MRTFIAIDLDSPLKEELKALVRDLAPLASHVRWVQAGGMHLTLKFLGETTDDKAAAVAAALQAIVAGRPRFMMRLVGMGVFPPGRRLPRVVWVGVESGPQLPAVQKEIESAASGLGFEPEQREFLPHLTLGRVRFPGPMERLLQEMDSLAGRDFGKMEVGRLTYYRSVLAPGGAEYSVLGEFSLG